MTWLFASLLIAALIAWSRREAVFRRRESAHASRVEELLGEQARLRNQHTLAEANLEIILSSIQDGVLVLDKRRSVRMANPAAQKMFNLPSAHTGKNVLELVREPEVDAMVAAAVEKSETREAELTFPARKPPMILAVRVAPMRDALGESGALAMFHDIGHMKRLEEVRREFVANVSHELRTPLAVFEGYVEQLRDSPEMPREQQAETFEVLRRNAARLSALVEDLLLLARMESRADELYPEEIDVPEFFGGVVRDFALRADRKGVTLRVDVPANIAPLYADPLRMEQVFTNLVDNALKFTPDGGTVTLGASSNDREILLWVSDTGQGILSSHLPHIFERFYRVDKGRGRDTGGTGLGLSIVKHIARAHGGDAKAESTFGKGTTIRLQLPNVA